MGMYEFLHIGVCFNLACIKPATELFSQFRLIQLTKLPVTRLGSETCMKKKKEDPLEM